MTASNDRRARRRRPPRWRLFYLILGVVLLAPGLALQASATPVKADALSDAIAEQQRLAKLIADQQTQLAGLSAQQTALRNQIAATQQNLAGVRTSIATAQAQISALQGEMAGVKTSFNDLAAEQALLETKLAEVTAEQNAAQCQLDARQQILAGRLVAAYETDQTPLLEQLLTAHSLTEALSDVSYYGDLAQADKALADEIARDQQTLAEMHQTVAMASTANAGLKGQVGAQQKSLEDEQAQLAAAQDQLNSLQAQLEAQLAQQVAAEAKLAKNKTALAAAIESNGQAMDDLAAKIDPLVKQQGGAGKIPSQYSGTLQWPMGGIITQQFGCTGVLSEPRVGSCAHFHLGIDIAAPCLTPVHAAGAGVVVFVGYNPYDAPPRAWLVIIAHSTSMVTWYAHMTAKAPPGIYVGAVTPVSGHERLVVHLVDVITRQNENRVSLRLLYDVQVL
ncbi:MAG: peptidoglycan DD-metalloendopeptidase family protein, partial [Candidatus Limnocylindrales bacterium]